MKTKEQKIQDITDKVIENDPSILELKFGCKYRLFGVYTIIVNNLGKNRYLLDNGKLISKEMIEQAKYCKIIGRDITLEDVLIVLEKQENNSEFYKGNYAVLPNGEFIIVCRDIEFTDVYWKPKTPLHLQKPEVIDFLHDILITNK